jgi:hypothetical protein
VPLRHTCASNLTLQLVALACQRSPQLTVHTPTPHQTAPKCDDEDSFYSSISGNDALAAGMFDISVVCAELGADSAPVPEEPRTDSGVESIEPSPSVSSQSEGSVDAPAAVSVSRTRTHSDLEGRAASPLDRRLFPWGVAPRFSL